jgi:hypothetical protein
MAAVSVVNLVIQKGTDFEEEFNLAEDDGSPLNLVGYTAAAKIRKHPTSPKYTPFVITFIDREGGRIKISLNNSQTLQLQSGRNYYDLIIIDGNQKIKKIVEGNIIVNDTATVGIIDSENLDGLGNIDISNVQDGYVLMYDLDSNKYIFVDPDDVLSKAVQDDSLPEDFLNQLDIDLDDRINLDSGEF